MFVLLHSVVLPAFDWNCQITELFGPGDPAAVTLKKSKVPWQNPVVPVSLLVTEFMAGSAVPSIAPAIDQAFVCLLSVTELVPATTLIAQFTGPPSQSAGMRICSNHRLEDVCETCQALNVGPAL